MPLTAPLVILGQISAAAFAAGLNLYLTVALIGLTSRLGLIPALPPGLKGLENLVLIASAVLLYLIEFIIDKIPHADSIWDALHTFIRPLGAALLTGLALGSASLPYQLGAAVLAFAIALAAHGTKAGLRLVLNIKPSKLRNTLISTLEDLLAAGFAVAALMYPLAAAAAVAGAAALLVLLGPRQWRAVGLGARAFVARVRAFFGERGWRSSNELPARLRPLVPPVEVGRGEHRALRAALKGVPGVPAYRNGWIVISYDRAAFVYRNFFRSRSCELPKLHEPRLRRGIWTDAIDFNVNGRTATLFLLKDGPATEVAIAHLAEVS